MSLEFLMTVELCWAVSSESRSCRRHMVIPSLGPAKPGVGLGQVISAVLGTASDDDGNFAVAMLRRLSLRRGPRLCGAAYVIGTAAQKTPRKQQIPGAG